jgi:hypothetical protein
MSAEPGRRPRGAARAAPKPRAGAKPRAKPRAGAKLRAEADRPYLVEFVLFRLYDVGRAVDLGRAAALVPAHSDFGPAKRRDTPASLTLPIPLVLDLGGYSECSDLGGLERLSAQAKIYEEGVVTVVERARARLPLGAVHSFEERRVRAREGEMSVSAYSEALFPRLYEALAPAITEPRELGDMDMETYRAFCFLDCGEDPASFVASRREYCASLLIGEEPGAPIHESQIEATLGSPFSYREGDLAIFDLDRCLVIDPRGDYEDLLLIAEHANYQLLELRALDKLLDRWLDEAEDLARAMSSGRRGMKRKLFRGRGEAGIDLARIQSLRIDALFILENLENSSKIIGDYYLGQVYARLCQTFNTEGWKWSVERRLDVLQDLYDMVKAEAAESRMVALEIIFIAVCAIFPILQIVQVMLSE